MMASIIRGMIKRLPFWLWRRIILRMASVRLQASFLPPADDKSKLKPVYQRSLQKTLAILKDLAENPAILATESSAPITV